MAPASPHLPRPRGPLSSALVAWWTDGHPLPDEIGPVANALVDDDLHLALWACYQLHYGGFAGVDDALEWDPATLGFRARLEALFERDLRIEHRPDDLPTDPACALRAISGWAGPPLARTVGHRGTLDEVREVAIHRSAYQLKEADPHTWAIPRLRGPGRAAMVEIQADEYGDGVPGEAHSELFAAALAGLGLDPAFGAYVDRLPGVTLATDNLISMFGLHRRLRGAAVGHLALFEMCSVVPMGHYLRAAQRIGGLPALERFYEVHVQIDEHHARLALEEMVTPMVAADPALGPDVVFGAAALSRVEARLAGHVLRAWAEGRSSLLPAEAEASPAAA
ncbi:MAG TPA: iron-containing redox enzyme family protein [Iamia sp.]